MQRERVRSWLEIDTKALEHNFRQLKKAAHSTTSTSPGHAPLLMSVVKSNAYGHGMIACAKVFARAGTDWLGVDDVDEALALRASGIKKPILVFGYTLPARYLEAAQKNISLTISSAAQFENIKVASSKAQAAFKIHLKIDTGLHRQGISPESIDTIIKTLRAKGRIKIEGVYSHFAAAENPQNADHVAFTKKQIAKFNHAIAKFRAEGFNPITHIAGTAATLLFPEARFDMVRGGIGLYGLWPNHSIADALKNSSVRPALAWKSVISEVKRVKKGERVGYDLTERLLRDSKLAVVPVGYWHGYPRALSNKGFLSVRGTRCKIVGRIAMDMMIIDATNVRGAREGDEVELIGKHVTADELAKLARTINYEIITRINPVILRKFI